MPESPQNDTPIGFTFSNILPGPRHPGRGREQGVKSTGVGGKQKVFCLLKLLCDLGQVICSLTSEKNGAYPPGLVPRAKGSQTQGAHAVPSTQ